MSRRVLSTTPSAIRARERRFNTAVEKEHAEFQAKVHALFVGGMAFDDAWVAAGGDEPIPIILIQLHELVKEGAEGCR